MTQRELYELMIYRLILCIWSMFKSLLFTLPTAFIVALIALLFIRKCQLKGKYIQEQKKTAIVLLVVYIAVLLQITVLLRPYGAVLEIDLIPFDRYGGVRYIILYSLANMVAFFPIGFLLPRIWTRFNSLKRILLVGFFGSLLIEMLQLALQCGVCQTEDLIMNTLGAVMGYRLYKKTKRKKKK